MPALKSDRLLALKRNRTADRILTMDVLCQLSYKGILRSFIKIAKINKLVKTVFSFFAHIDKKCPVEYNETGIITT